MSLSRGIINVFVCSFIIFIASIVKLSKIGSNWHSCTIQNNYRGWLHWIGPNSAWSWITIGSNLSCYVGGLTPLKIFLDIEIFLVINLALIVCSLRKPAESWENWTTLQTKVVNKYLIVAQFVVDDGFRNLS